MKPQKISKKRLESLKNLTEEEGDSLIVKSVPKENFNVPKHPLKAEWKKFDKEHPAKAKPSPKKVKVLMKPQKISKKRLENLKNLTEEEGDSLIVKSVPKENFNVPKHPLKAEWKKFDAEHPVKAKPSPKKAKVLMKS